MYSFSMPHLEGAGGHLQCLYQVRRSDCCEVITREINTRDSLVCLTQMVGGETSSHALLLIPLEDSFSAHGGPAFSAQSPMVVPKG